MALRNNRAGRRPWRHLVAAALGWTLMANGGCLPDNFWVDAFSQVVNLGVLSVAQPVIDSAAGALSGGASG